LFSGAERLPNGNTLICSGVTGTIFEVTAEKEVVWKYTNPARGRPAPRGSRSLPPGVARGRGGGPGGPGGPPRPGQILPPSLQDSLKLTPRQRERLEDLQKVVDGQLDTMLKDEQLEQLNAMRADFDRGGPRGPGGPGGLRRPAQPGQIIPPFVQDRLKLT